MAPTQRTLTDWYDAWIVERALRPASVRVYTNTVGRLVRQIGPVRLDKLTTPFIAASVAALQAKGMGTRQMVLAYGYLKGCLGVAVERRLIAVNPILGVPVPKHTATPKTRWSLDDALKFVFACQTSKVRWAPLYSVLATSGLRIGEALGLTWGDINLSARTLRVERAQVWVGAEVEEGPLKTQAARRTVSLPRLALTALLKQRSLCPDTGPDAPVFRTLHGGIPRHDQLQAPLARICREAGVTRTNVHGLRHVAAALAYEGTHNVLAVQQRLGHTRASTTMNIYAHLMQDDSAVASALDMMLSVPEDGVDVRDTLVVPERPTKLARDAQRDLNVTGLP